MTKKEDGLNSVISFAMAKRSMDAMQRYVAAGRTYQSVGSDDLEAMFIACFRKWVAEFNDTERPFIDDMSAEYELRNEDPPYEGLKSEMDQLDRRFKGVLANVTPDRMEELGEKLVDDYQAALKEKQ